MKNSLFMLLMFLLTACSKSFKEEDLVGKWKYVKVEYLAANPVVVEEGEALDSKDAFFEFKPDGTARIFSSGKVLSEGTFTVENSIIRYQEVFEDGATRNIPFLINELDNGKLVFESMEKDVKRITAIKE